MKKFNKYILFLVIFAIVTLITLFVYPNNNYAVSDNIKFAQFSDVHYTIESKDTSHKVLSDSKELFLDAVKQINDIAGLDFVIVTGDAVDQPTVDSFQAFVKIMNTIKYPWYYTTGNHDVAAVGEMSKKTLLGILREENKSFIFDNLYYSFDFSDDYKIIVLDGVINGIKSANAQIPKEQLEWLNSQLNVMKDKDQVALIFLHFPIVEPHKAIHHRILNAKEFENVLKQYNFPIAIFTGHYHSERIYQDKNILHVSSPSLVTYPNAFRVVTITNQKEQVIFEFDLYETELLAVHAKSKIKVIDRYKKYIAHHKDEKIVVTMKKLKCR